MKADSRNNEKVEGSRYISILWQEYWDPCQLRLQSQTLHTVRELSVQLKQLHIGDTPLFIILKGRSCFHGNPPTVNLYVR